MSRIELHRTTKSDAQLKSWMAVHYSQPKGFVGRQLIYKVIHDGVTYGAIVAGSTPKHLPGRAEFYGRDVGLNNIVNNTFFHIEKQNGTYPLRNFLPSILSLSGET